MAAYLQNTDLAAFDVPNATSGQIQQASLLIDAYLQRPEGMIYTVDGSGNPLAMENTGAPILQSFRMSPRGRQLILLNRPNAQAVLSVQYAQNGYGLPVWQPVAGFRFQPGAGLYVPLDLSGYQVQVEYVAGWLYAALPFAIKQACANLITAASGVFQGINGNVSSVKAGDAQVTRFKDTVMDSDTKALLQPYQVTML